MGGTLSIPDVQLPPDRTFLITGANTGIGYFTAKRIAQLGPRVVITCRTEEKAKNTIERMQKEHEEEFNAERTKNGEEPASAPKLNLQFMTLELGSLKSTMKFIEQYKSSGLPLHVLICNAGLMIDTKVITEDGYETHFQVNCLSHFLLTLHLLPLLKASAPNSRIVNVSSKGHEFGKWNLDNVQGEKSFGSFWFYCHSKIYQIMNMHVLAEKLADTEIRVFSIHPGFVATDINRSPSGFIKFFGSAIGMLGIVRNSEKGSFTTIVAAVDKTYDQNTALYFDSCKPVRSNALSRNKEKQEQVWRYSLECLKQYLTDDVLKEIGEKLSDISDTTHTVAKTEEGAATVSSQQDEAAAENTKEAAAENTKE